jgi:pimeloyl-ACP methyl ester carboxylesterase
MRKPKLILVHGAWQSAWCWQLITPLLKQTGVDPITLDLPGRNGINAHQTQLFTYIEAVINLIENYDEPIYLLGHSLAGVIISGVAERIPDRIQGVIYATAFLLQNQQTILDTIPHNNSSLISGLHFNEHTIAVDPNYIIPSFLHHCSADIAKWAQSNWSIEPLLPMKEPLTITAENFGRVPKYYLLCTDDQSIAPSLQHTMCNQYQGEINVTEINSDHSPFLSHPDEMVDYLRGICLS